MSKTKVAVIVFLLVLFFSGCGKPISGMYAVRMQPDVKFADREIGPLFMNIGYPVSDNTSPRPAILWLHGGAYTVGDRHYMKDMIQFTSSVGYVSASAEYRMIPQGAKMSDIYADARDAFLFLHQNADELGIDPDRISIGGDSAGGHLALLVGLQESGVRSIVDIYGPTDFVAFYESTKGTWKETVLMLTMGKTPDEDPEAWFNASPINFVSANSPPVLILHGTKDGVIPFEQAIALRNKMSICGARFVYAPVEGASHGWVIQSWGNTSLRTFPIIAQFLKQENCEKEYSK